LNPEQVEASLRTIHDFRHLPHASALIDLLQVDR
jgi:hypothetical protein